MKSRRVVVTGLGALTPIGNNVEEFWNNCIAGKSGAAEITKFDASKFKTRFACEVKNFEIERFFQWGTPEDFADFMLQKEFFTYKLNLQQRNIQKFPTQDSILHS